MEKKDIKIIAAVALLLSAIPLLAYIYKFGSFTLSSKLNDWNLFSGFLGGLLSPLFSFITLSLTAYIAYTIKEYDRKKDKQNKEQDDIKAYLELYQYFVSPDFREKRTVAWNVLRRAIENPEYAEFIVKENLVSRYTDRMHRSEVYNKFKSIYKESINDKKEFLHQESEDRHKLDALVNFFELLSVKDVPPNNCGICDFYYDSWRPLLCWYAKKLEKGYNEHEINKQYSNQPGLRTAIESLDKKYFNPLMKNSLTVDTIDEHPIIKWYNLKESDD